MKRQGNSLNKQTKLSGGRSRKTSLRTSRGIWVREEPKRPRGRPKKTTTAETTKRPRGRPKKTTTAETTKRPRGRPKKTTTAETTKRPNRPSKRTSRGIWVYTGPKKVVSVPGKTSVYPFKEPMRQKKESDEENSKTRSGTRSKPPATLDPPKSNKINTIELNKTLKQIDKEVAKVLDYYVVDISKKEIASITDYLMSKIKDIVTENMKSNQKIVYRKFSKQVENKVIGALQNVKFIRYVCYDNNSRGDRMKLIVLHDHKNNSTAFDVVYGIVDNLNYYFSRLRIAVDTISISDIDDITKFLKQTTILIAK